MHHNSNTIHHPEVRLPIDIKVHDCQRIELCEESQLIEVMNMKNVNDSILVNREFESNESDESDLQHKKLGTRSKSPDP
jgi:hypothetical protein